MKVTRTLIANTPLELTKICQLMGFVRADIWRRFGGLQNVGKNANAIRTQITKEAYYTNLPVDGTIRSETTKDIVNDILAYKAAALVKVKKAIATRTTDESERKQLFTTLKSDNWLSNHFLHRQMRKHFKHGKSHTNNQFIVRSDKYSTAIVNGFLTITILIAKKYGSNLVLTTNSSGKNVKLTNSNLRIIVKNGYTEIHYATEKVKNRDCGTKVIGIDKGYTEAFMDSDGVAHGLNFGKVLTAFSDKNSATMEKRNKLHALEKKHRKAGKTAKADRIKLNNLGRVKLNNRKQETKAKIRTIAFTAAHAIVDKASVVVSEDLTFAIESKHQWKQFNRKMSAWAKGVLAEALDSVCLQREAEHCLVNCAYTSQMDSLTGLLEGKRVGDKFYRVNGDVLQADFNAALNVLARRDDPDITRFMTYKTVRQILLARSPAQLRVNRLELEDNSCQPSADKF